MEKLGNLVSSRRFILAFAAAFALQYEQSIVKGQVWPDPVFFGAWPYHLACFASSMDVSRPTRVFAV